MKGKLIIFSAPSGSGKSTIINYLLTQDLNLAFSISATSRPPRGEEKHGVEYFFLSPDEFRQRIANNEFLEYEEVYKDRYYGTLKAQVEQQLEAGQNVVFDVDVVGGCNIKKFYGERALSLFIQPPSVDELRRRLTGRGTDAPEVIEHRIAKAEYELSFASQSGSAESNQRVSDIMSKLKTGIFSGSFNPIHIGHLALANYLCEFCGLDEVWFVVSPHNPLKEQADLWPDELRLRLVQLAIGDYPHFRASDFEFHLPRPSYTVHTLDCLKSSYPEREFHLIIGSDNWLTFDRWREPERIIAENQILIYPRPGYPVNKDELPGTVRIVDSPTFEISSTFIRRALTEGKDVRYFLHPAVYRLLRAEL